MQDATQVANAHGTGNGNILTPHQAKRRHRKHSHHRTDTLDIGGETESARSGHRSRSKSRNRLRSKSRSKSRSGRSRSRARNFFHSLAQLSVHRSKSRGAKWRPEVSGPMIGRPFGEAGISPFSTNPNPAEISASVPSPSNMAERNHQLHGACVTGTDGTIAGLTAVNQAPENVANAAALGPPGRHQRVPSRRTQYDQDPGAVPAAQRQGAVEESILSRLLRLDCNPEPSCGVCNQSISHDERLLLPDILMHKKCFKCAQCNAPLATQSAIYKNNTWTCAKHNDLDKNTFADIVD